MTTTSTRYEACAYRYSDGHLCGVFRMNHTGERAAGHRFTEQQPRTTPPASGAGSEAHNFVPQDDYYVRLCGICGFSKSQHGLPASAVQEKSERYNFVVFTGRHKILDYHKPDGQQIATADGEEEARTIVRALNAVEQHYTLVEQQERLIDALFSAVSEIEILEQALEEYHGTRKPNPTLAIIREVIGELEQQQSRTRTTEREG